MICAYKLCEQRFMSTRRGHIYCTTRCRNRQKSLLANRRRKKQCVDYKGGKCEVCGYNKCMAALEFHHIDPAKKTMLISNSGRSCVWPKVRKELDICIMVCANCHREIEQGITPCPDQ